MFILVYPVMFILSLPCDMFIFSLPCDNPFGWPDLKDVAHTQQKDQVAYSYKNKNKGRKKKYYKAICLK